MGGKHCQSLNVTWGVVGFSHFTVNGRYLMVPRHGPCVTIFLTAEIPSHPTPPHPREKTGSREVRVHSKENDLHPKLYHKYKYLVSKLLFLLNLKDSLSELISIQRKDQDIRQQIPKSFLNCFSLFVLLYQNI